MSDVEKYGLVGVVFVVGVLGLILVYGGEGGLDGAEGSQKPVVIRKPSEAIVPPPRSSGNTPRTAGHRATDLQPRAEREPRTRPVRSYRVDSLVSDKPFEFSEPPVIYPGERSVPPTLASSEGRVFHTIRPNETLSDVSKHFFGTTAHWRDILALNPGLDPLKLQVGDTIVVEGPAAAPQPPAVVRPVAVSPAAAATPARSDPSRTYLVRKGDTLGAIAQRELGSVRQSQRLFDANKDVLSSPDKLKPGMKLRIP